MPTAAIPLTIFYDASCPVCRDEIGLLKQYDTDDALKTEDCSPAHFQPPTDAPTHVTRDAMMNLIHARDANGQWLVGAPVFAAAYAACGFPLFEKIWGARRLQPMWNVIYPWVAKNRMLLSRFGVSHVLSWLLAKMYARSVKQKTFCGVDRNQCEK